MKNDLFKGNENHLPPGRPKKTGPPKNYSWIASIVKAILGIFSRQGKRTRKIQFKKTEITKDRYIQQEFTYTDKQTTKD